MTTAAEDGGDRVYRCGEMRCGAGAEVVPDPAVVKDDAYWAEVEAAVGKGAPSILLGTSARSLKRNLAKLREITGTGTARSPGRG